MNVGKPKIILFDIESLPDLRQVMKYLPQIDDWPGQSLKAHINSVLCIGWKELGSKKVNIIRAWDGPNWDKNLNDDKYVLEEFRKVVESADCLVGHNSKKFDWPFLQTRIMVHGLLPYPTKIQHVDTRNLARSNLRAISNKLDHIAALLNQPKKMDNGGWELWERVIDRDEKALDTMEKYCKQDVRVLENVYMKLRPFAREIPNYNLFSLEGVRCPTCGSLNLMKNGTRVTSTGQWQRLICGDCGKSAKLGLKDQFVKP